MAIGRITPFVPRDQMDSMTVHSTTSYTTLTDLVADVNSLPTGGVLIARTNTTLGASFFESSINVAPLVIVMKGSLNNAYYFATAKNFAAVGNISLANESVNIVNEFARKSDLQLRSVSYTYSANAGGAANTNLKALIDADMPSGYEFVALSGFTSDNNQCIFYTCRYYNNNYSLGIRNVGSSNVTSATAVVYYLCKPS